MGPRAIGVVLAGARLVVPPARATVVGLLLLLLVVLLVLRITVVPAVVFVVIRVVIGIFVVALWDLPVFFVVFAVSGGGGGGGGGGLGLGGRLGCRHGSRQRRRVLLLLDTLVAVSRAFPLSAARQGIYHDLLLLQLLIGGCGRAGWGESVKRIGRMGKRKRSCKMSGC